MSVIFVNLQKIEIMKKIYNLFILFVLVGFAAQANAQNCKKTCEVQKQVGEGVFLGVQIHSHHGESGVHVLKVVEGTQAEAMGIEKGDVIIAVNGVEMESTPFMIEWVADQYAGMPVSVSLNRKGKVMDLKGELGYKTVQTVMETICCDETVGKLELADLKAYPNPSSGQFTLSFMADSDAPMEMRIVDLSGNIAFENTLYPKGGVVNERVAVNAAVSGDYILLLSQDEKTIEKKMVFIK